MKPQLIPEARYWYRLFTIQGITFIAAVQGALIVTPAKWLILTVPFLSMTWTDFGQALTVAAAAITGFARLVKQTFPGEFEETKPTGFDDLK